ncbi:MAG: hypothetical protein M3044_04410 [Thermoproteota archaeon]|nr:hypothetical protein [Thermoproteota archaeon]
MLKLSVRISVFDIIDTRCHNTITASVSGVSSIRKSVSGVSSAIKSVRAFAYNRLARHRVPGQPCLITASGSWNRRMMQLMDKNS